MILPAALPGNDRLGAPLDEQSVFCYSWHVHETPTPTGGVLLKTHFLWALATLIALFTGLIAGFYIDPDPEAVVDAADAMTARCVGVLDGDTIRVEWQGNTEDIRILGIDCPETRRSNKLKGQAATFDMDPEHMLTYGKIAKKTAQNWLMDRNVRIVFPGDEVLRDAFGRLLAYVDQQGVDFGERLLLGGNAMTSDESTHPRMEAYALFEAEAQKQHKGLWRNYEAPGAKASSRNPARRKPAKAE